ncbi:MAG: mechanosensitive ion channel family protein [Fimbriimonadales bacterium]|nr:mechanosensitive ion channel family protein [Fimbriimonadales bacterium]
MRRSATLALLAPGAAWGQTLADRLKGWAAEGSFVGWEAWQWLGLGLAMLCSAAAALVAWVVMLGIQRARYRLAPKDFAPQPRRGMRRGAGLAAAGWTLLQFLEPLQMARVRPLEAGAVTVATIGLTWLAISWWDAFCEAIADRAAAIDRRAERILIPVLRKFVRALIGAGGVLTGLWWLGANVPGIVAGLGIGGVALALAAKDSVENVFGSLTIVFDMPFALGDWVRIGDVYGKVEEINLRSTRIRLPTGALVTLPNSNLIRASVENAGDLSRRRVAMSLPLSLDSAPDRIRAFCAAARDALQKVPQVDPETVRVAPTDIQSAGLLVTAVCWLDAPTWDEELEAREAIITELLRLADENGVVLQGVPRWGPAPG